MELEKRKRALEKINNVYVRLGTPRIGNPSLGERLQDYRKREIKDRLNKARQILSGRTEPIGQEDYMDAFSTIFDQGVGSDRSLIYTRIDDRDYVGRVEFAESTPNKPSRPGRLRKPKELGSI